jgi:superfamily II DNA or RNA helicase
MTEPIELSYDRDTLVVAGEPSTCERLPYCQFDPRTGKHRAIGRHYRAIVEYLRREKIAYTDKARAWEPTEWKLTSSREPYPHQREAVAAWWQAGGQGVVVLPTGTGKTFTAMLAMAKAARPVLVITPTIDLINQWYYELSAAFGVPVGLLGGGHYDLQAMTVSTYDSAYLHVERWGNRYGMLVFDECHHLPGPTYSVAALAALAPYRLGLSATPERSDGGEVHYPDLIGPIVYRKEINELEGEFLAEYRTERIFVDLTPEEQRQYVSLRHQYKQFIQARGLRIGSPAGWQRFIIESTRSPEGRAAFRAYRQAKQLERTTSAKFEVLSRLLAQHQHERIIVFTADNATVYRIARQFLVPALTHQTKTKERRLILERFHQGDYPVIVTSQVLNEGVDVPAASVGIILSGTGTTRESVQRLGRILRKHGEKQALLYELVARGTAEEYTSDRRRQHSAFKPTPPPE